ncbi:MAG: hypothetical protein AB1898_32325, partial [Acidobacteriota bacterium]
PTRAVAAYKKVLNLKPEWSSISERLAQLYVELGQMANAKLQYRALADQKLRAGEEEKATEIFQRLCSLDPNCCETQHLYAQQLERGGRIEEACDAYLQSAKLLLGKGQFDAAQTVAERILTLKPRSQTFLKAFFPVLRQTSLVNQGLEYLGTLPLDHDLELEVIVGELLADGQHLEAARHHVIKVIGRNPQIHPLGIRLLQKLIEARDMAGCLELVEAMFEAVIQVRQEAMFGLMLEGLLDIEPGNVRVLKIMTTLLIRSNDREKLAPSLKRLVCAQLQQGQAAEAQDTLNNLVIHDQSSMYLDSLKILNQAMNKGQPQRLSATCQRLAAVIEHGSTQSFGGVALGVTDLDLSVP